MRWQERPDPEPSEPVFSWRPECLPCTWVWWGGRFKLKYVNRVCDEHRSLLYPLP